MMFTSPVFIFLFIPVMLAVCVVTPKRLFRYAVCLCSLSFYLLANFRRPACVLLLLMCAIFTYCASYAVSAVRRAPVLIFAVGIPLLILATLRVTAMSGGQEAIGALPVGASFFLLSSVSAVIDVRRGDAPPPRSFLDILVYITYFPVMIAGPVIRYKDFVRLSSPENIRFSFRNTAGGIVLFSLGFIKRVAIAEVLSEAYERIASQLALPDQAGMNLNLGVVLSLGVLLLVSVYYTFDGYSDMGRGLSMMLGIPLACDFGSCLFAYTVTEYAENFMHSLSGWMRDYLMEPLERIGEKHGKFFSHIAAPAALTVMMFWYRAGANVMLAMIPMLLWAMAERALDLRAVFGRNLVLRTIGRGITWGGFAFFWLLVRTQNVGSLVSALSRLTVGEPVQSYTLYLTLINREYLFVGLLILFVRIPVLYRMICARHPSLSGSRRKAWLQVGWSFAILAVFMLSVVFLLPQYPEIAVTPFRGMSL